MPRNGSSVYSLPAGNPVIAGTVIATTWANTTLTDIATALTNSLSTDGSTASVSLAGKTMTGGTFSGPTVTSVLTLTGGQIAFPAVAVPAAGANVLDDYEEGTWTPTLTFATPGNLNVVYATRLGAYTKIGRQVTLTFEVQTSTFTHTTASGSLNMTGVPFASATGHATSGAISWQTVTGASRTNLVARISDTQSLLTFVGSADGLGVTSVGTGVVPTGTVQAWVGSITYFAAT